MPLNIIPALLFLLGWSAEPSSPQDAEGGVRRLVEYFRPLPPYIWDLSLIRNSCTSVDQVRCVLRVERRQREIIRVPKMEEDPQEFIVDRFSAFSWETLGYTLPFEEGVREDILSCDRMDWLPASYPSPVSVFAWTFQGEFRSLMFPDQVGIPQHALVARGASLDFLDTFSATPAHMDSLSMPPWIEYFYHGDTPWGGFGEALAKMNLSDSTEFVFLSSDFKDHPLALGRDEHFCAVGFSLNRRPPSRRRTVGEGVLWENTRPLSADSRDVHQVFAPEAFRGIVP